MSFYLFRKKLSAYQLGSSVSENPTSGCDANFANVCRCPLPLSRVPHFLPYIAFLQGASDDYLQSLTSFIHDCRVSILGPELNGRRIHPFLWNFLEPKYRE